MKSLILPAFLLFQAFFLVSSTPSLRSVDISAHPHVYKPSQTFTLTCTVNVSPPDSGYGVGIKHNGTSIGWWTNFNGFGFTWDSEPAAKYIVAGSASYPQFTATIRGGYPETRGVYKCVAYYGEHSWSVSDFGSIETADGYNTNGSLALPSNAAIFAVLCILILKSWL